MSKSFISKDITFCETEMYMEKSSSKSTSNLPHQITLFEMEVPRPLTKVEGVIPKVIEEQAIEEYEPVQQEKLHNNSLSKDKVR